MRFAVARLAEGKAMNRALLLFAAALLAQSGVATAQGWEGRVNAAVYAEVPAGAAVTVQPRDDTEANLEIKDVFEQELIARGYRIAADAPLLMTFWTSGSYDLAQRGRRGPGLLLLGAEGGTRLSKADTDVEAQVKLFSSEGGGLFQNPAARPKQKPIGGNRHRLDASLKDRASGRRIWQGQAYADVSGGDSLSISEAMVPALADSFAKTVRRGQFTVE
jgi:hypothetical protein